MKNLISTLPLILLCICVSYAQPPEGPGHQQHFARIHAAKVAYIADRLQLTAQQSEQFWPIYSRYDQEIMDIRHKFMDKYRNSDPENSNVTTAHEYVDADLDYQQAVIDLKRKYNLQFAKIISAQQLAGLYTAEREFRRMLIQQLKDHHGGDGGGNGGGGNGKWKN